MYRTCRIVTFTLLLAPPVWASDAPQIIPYQDLSALAEGEKIYGKFCAACHGRNRTGEPDWRRRNDNGYLPAPPHDASGHTWQHDDTQLFSIVRDGAEAVAGEGYKSRMNGFGHLLSDAEILQVLAYIKAGWPDRLIAHQSRLSPDTAHSVGHHDN